MITDDHDDHDHTRMIPGHRSVVVTDTPGGSSAAGAAAAAANVTASGPARLRMVKLEDAPTFCGFLGDIQGDFGYFEKYVEISRILSWEDESNQSLLLADNAIFVFGGNVQGSGIGDIRITKLFLDLKKKYPDRVKLLMGYKDVILLKLTEISDDALKEASSENKLSIPLGPDLNKYDRIRWMLQALTGSEGSFENRRSELALLAGEPDSTTISDDDVADSFSEQVRPGAENGLLLQYLAKAQLAFIFDATLFTHGGLPSRSLGTIPDHDTITR